MGRDPTIATAIGNQTTDGMEAEETIVAIDQGHAIGGIDEEIEVARTNAMGRAVRGITGRIATRRIIVELEFVARAGTDISRGEVWRFLHAER